jgi:hypothetical protein
VFATRSTGAPTRLAYLLCGDQHLARDLVRTCLLRLQAWPKVRDKDTADQYARKVLLLAERAGPDVAAVPSRGTARATPRAALRRGLAAAPSR